MRKQLWLVEDAAAGCRGRGRHRVAAVCSHVEVEEVEEGGEVAWRFGDGGIVGWKKLCDQAQPRQCGCVEGVGA